jgi:hypothetical protein
MILIYLLSFLHLIEYAIVLWIEIDQERGGSGIFEDIVPSAVFKILRTVTKQSTIL